MAFFREWKVDKGTGKAVAWINPFANVAGVDAMNNFVSGPLTTDRMGNICYNVIELNLSNGNPALSRNSQGAFK